MSALVDRIRPFLRSNTFFGGLPDDALDALIGKGHTKKYAKGATIYRRGESGDSLMVVLSGRIKISNTTADAREVILNFLGVGDVNGEIAALDRRERTADAVALEDCEVFTVYARDLVPTLTAHPEAMLDIINILCDKLRSASAIIEDNTLEMRGRTAKGLLRLCQQHGRTGKDGVRLQLAVSQRELGSYLGVSRANVSRQLGELRDANVIRIDGTQITITDEEGLSAIAAASSRD
jgi:CRP/FNR family transcriptional regulator, cyclic AMP receptor protein